MERCGRFVKSDNKRPAENDNDNDDDDDDDDDEDDNLSTNQK